MEQLNELNIACDDFSQIDFDRINSVELLNYYKLKCLIADTMTTDSEIVGISYDNLGKIYNNLTNRKIMVKKPYHETTSYRV